MQQRNMAKRNRHSESSASTPEISLDYAYDEAPIDQYEEQNQNVTGLIKKKTIILACM